MTGAYVIIQHIEYLDKHHETDSSVNVAIRITDESEIKKEINHLNSHLLEKEWEYGEKKYFTYQELPSSGYSNDFTFHFTDYQLQIIALKKEFLSLVPLVKDVYDRRNIEKERGINLATYFFESVRDFGIIDKYNATIIYHEVAESLGL